MSGLVHDAALRRPLMATAPGTPVGLRLQWIDAARGACVVAVILYHVCSWQFLLTVLIHRVLERIGLGVLFDPPAGYTGGIVRLHGRLRATRHLEANGRDIESAQAVQPLRLPSGRLP